MKTIVSTPIVDSVQVTQNTAASAMVQQDHSNETVVNESTNLPKSLENISQDLQSGEETHGDWLVVSDRTRNNRKQFNANHGKNIPIIKGYNKFSPLSRTN